MFKKVHVYKRYGGMMEMRNILLNPFARTQGGMREPPCFCNGGGRGRKIAEAAVERKQPLAECKIETVPEKEKPKAPEMNVPVQQPVDIMRVNGGGFF